ncbi:MAG: hypothetical protein K8S54_10415 [Spirochaetia bacterium]|nr:hypothetical protein [Spirochaetia bacterium]
MIQLALRLIFPFLIFMITFCGDRESNVLLHDFLRNNAAPTTSANTQKGWVQGETIADAKWQGDISGSADVGPIVAVNYISQFVKKPGTKDMELLRCHKVPFERLHSTAPLNITQETTKASVHIKQEILVEVNARIDAALKEKKITDIEAAALKAKVSGSVFEKVTKDTNARLTYVTVTDASPNNWFDAGDPTLTEALSTCASGTRGSLLQVINGVSGWFVKDLTVSSVIVEEKSLLADLSASVSGVPKGQIIVDASADIALKINKRFTKDLAIETNVKNMFIPNQFRLRATVQASNILPRVCSTEELNTKFTPRSKLQCKPPHSAVVRHIESNGEDFASFINTNHEQVYSSNLAIVPVAGALCPGPTTDAFVEALIQFGTPVFYNTGLVPTPGAGTAHALAWTMKVVPIPVPGLANGTAKYWMGSSYSGDHHTTNGIVYFRVTPNCLLK